MAAALKLGEEDGAAVGKLREELQKAWATLTASQEKVPQPVAAISAHAGLAATRLSCVLCKSILALMTLSRCAPTFQLSSHVRPYACADQHGKSWYPLWMVTEDACA